MAKQEFKLNPDIINSPVVLFVGAGASTPLGLKTTDGFLAEVQGKLEDRLEKSDSISKANVSHIRRLFDDSVVYSNENKPDVETVLDYIDYLQTAFSMGSNLPDWIGGIGGAGGFAASGFKGWASGLGKIREYMTKELIAHYSDVNPQKASGLYGWLLEALTPLAHSKGVLPVFTTNYDWVFERASEFENFKRMYGFEDGFGGEDVAKFNPKNFMGLNRYKRCLTLFKLHGSTSWRWRTSREKAVYKVQDIEELPPDKYVAIWPTLKSKADMLEKYPYNVLFGYLDQTLKQPKPCLVIVIGFSFRDEVIVKMFKDALKEKSDLAICVFDKNFDTSDGLNDAVLLPKLGLDSEDQDIRYFTHKAEFGDQANDEVIKENIQNAISKVFKKRNAQR